MCLGKATAQGSRDAYGHLAYSRIPLIGALASRDPCTVGSSFQSVWVVGTSESCWEIGAPSGCQGLDLAGDIPRESSQLARDRDADVVDGELARRAMPETLFAGAITSEAYPCARNCRARVYPQGA